MHDWLQWYVQQTEKEKAWARFRERFLCPCCFMPTLSARAAYELCAICDWEDDGQDSDDAEVVRGGPNGDYSLREGRENFKQFFTMYRPGHTLPFELDQIERPARAQLCRLFADAIWTESDESWQRALVVEKEFEIQKARQDQARH